MGVEVVLVPEGTRRGTVNVTRADNQVALLVNGQIIWHIRTEFDPALNQQIDFEIAGRGLTVLTVLGANWGGPANFQASISIPGLARQPTPISYSAGQTDPGITFESVYHFVNTSKKPQKKNKKTNSLIAAQKLKGKKKKAK